MEIPLSAGQLLLRNTLTIGLVAFLLPGCKTPTAVGMRMVLPAKAEIMSIPKNHGFLMASPLSQPMPIFPTDSPNKIDTNICIELVISESGAISSATPLYTLPDCPLAESDIDQKFAASAVDAAMKWQFLAAATCSFPDGAPKTDDCSGEGVVITPVPIKVSYVFSFQSGGDVIAKAKHI